MPNEYNQNCCEPINSIAANDMGINHPKPCDRCHSTPCICDKQLHIYCIKYKVTGTTIFIGQAIIQAYNKKEAECILAKDSRFNGYSHELRITSLTEVFPYPEPLLLQEDNVAILDRRILNTYPFLLKSEYQCLVNQLYDNLRESIEENFLSYKDEVLDKTIEDALKEINDKIDEKVNVEQGVMYNDYFLKVNEDGNVEPYQLFTEEYPRYTLDEKNNIEDINRSIDELNEDISGINNDISDINNDIQDLNTNLSTLDNKIHTELSNAISETTQLADNNLKQIKDLDSYQGTQGEIVQYVGETNDKYINGYIYKYDISEEETEVIHGTSYMNVLQVFHLNYPPAGLYYYQGKYPRQINFTIQKYKQVDENGTMVDSNIRSSKFSILVEMLNSGDVGFVWDNDSHVFNRFVIKKFTSTSLTVEDYEISNNPKTLILYPSDTEEYYQYPRMYKSDDNNTFYSFVKDNDDIYICGRLVGDNLYFEGLGTYYWDSFKTFYFKRDDNTSSTVPVVKDKWERIDVQPTHEENVEWINV